MILMVNRMCKRGCSLGRENRAHTLKKVSAGTWHIFFFFCESSLLRTNHTVPYKGACSTQRQRDKAHRRHETSLSLARVARAAGCALRSGSEYSETL